MTLIDMKDFHLPIFSEDITNEQISDSAKELKKMFMETDGFIFTCPEYNGTMTPLLNNLCAWMSRPFSKDEPMYAAFKGKFAMVASTSPGGACVAVIRASEGLLACPPVCFSACL